MITLAALADRPLWVAWQQQDRPGGKPTKVPYGPHGRPARANDPRSWGTRLQAEVCAATLPRPYGIGGVGIELGEPGNGTSIGGVDLDSCCDRGGPLLEWASDVVARLASYTETSSSGRGAKVFFLYATADLAALRVAGLIDAGDSAKRKAGFGRQFKRGGDDHPPAIELHLGNRYFAVTDQRLPDAPATLRLVSRDRSAVVAARSRPGLGREAGDGESRRRGWQPNRGSVSQGCRAASGGEDLLRDGGRATCRCGDRQLGA